MDHLPWTSPLGPDGSSHIRVSSHAAQVGEATIDIVRGLQQGPAIAIDLPWCLPIRQGSGADFVDQGVRCLQIFLELAFGTRSASFKNSPRQPAESHRGPQRSPPSLSDLSEKVKDQGETRHKRSILGQMGFKG